MDRRKRALVIALVAVHTLLIAAYTLPDQLVPGRLYVLAQRYARPLFHQQWKLFAPDPPLCSSEVQVAFGEEEWRSLHASDANYLTRRMARSIAWYVQSEIASGAKVPSRGMQRAMKSMVRDIGREVPGLRFRSKEACVIDPGRPSDREERITPLNLERP